jgi:hypothetical protein
MAIIENKKAVVTLSIGNKYDDLSSLTHPTIKDYARKIQADFIVIDRPKINLGGYYHFEKLQLYEILNSYSRAFFVDTDVLITPACPDVFSLVPADRLGAFIVSKYSDYHDEEIKLIQEELGDLNWKKECFNSGVMVLSSQHREVFDPNNYLVKQWAEYVATTKHRTSLDQTSINYLVQKLAIPIYDLGYKFNHTTAPNNSSDRFNSYIIHYPGKGHRRGKKIAQIQKDLSIINNPILWKISAQFPILNRVLDLF